MRAIICTQAKFDSLNELAINMLIAKDSNLNSVRWCNPVIHPVDGRIAFTVKGRINSVVKDEVVEILTGDWFPVIEL